MFDTLTTEEKVLGGGVLLGLGLLAFVKPARNAVGLADRSKRIVNTPEEKLLRRLKKHKLVDSNRIGIKLIDSKKIYKPTKGVKHYEVIDYKNKKIHLVHVDKNNKIIPTHQINEIGKTYIDGFEHVKHYNGK